MRRARVTIVTLEKQLVLNTISVCSLSYPEYKTRALYYVVSFGLSASTIFLHIIS